MILRAAGSSDAKLSPGGEADLMPQRVSAARGRSSGNFCGLT